VFCVFRSEICHYHARVNAVSERNNRQEKNQFISGINCLRRLVAFVKEKVKTSVSRTSRIS
jgi:hypothetical protein